MQNDKESHGENHRLVRGLGPLDATMIVVGSMIGSGIFITSAESARLTGAPGWLLLAWTIAGLMTITGALCCSELATMMPRAGGVYVFLREAYGPSLGFLFGWTLFLVIQTGTIAAVAIAFAKFVGVFAPAIATDYYLVGPVNLFGGYAISLSTEQLVAIALILLLTWTNTRGLETGKFVQNTFTFAKTAALLALIIIGLSLGWKADCAALSADWWDSWRNGWSPQTAQPGLTVVGGLALALLFGKAMVGPVFAQTAWTNVTFIGSEVRDPGRNLVRALLAGCGLVVVLYILANLAYVATLPLDGIEHAPQNRVAIAAMNSLFGKPGALAMAAAIMISTFGCNNGLILAGARVYYAMARDGLFFRRIATINVRNVPAAALVVQGIWAALLTLPRTVTTNPATGAVSYGNVYTQLLEYIVSADLVFYILLVVAVIVLRKNRVAAERPYRTWGYPIVPIISVLLAGFLIADLAYLAPTTSGIGYLLVLTGIPVYFAWRKGFSAEPQQSNRHGCLTAWLILMILTNAATAVSTPLMYDAIKRTAPNAAPVSIALITIAGVANIIFAVALFRWKKWGFVGFIATSIVALVTNLIIGLGIAQSVYGLVGIGILYWVLNMGGSNRAWTRLH